MPADSIYVFDACAVIALMDAEPGGEVVETLLAGEGHRCLVHVLNVCEVYYHIHRLADEDRANKLEGILRGYGFELIDSLSPVLWRRAGQIKARWRRVSLADCFALALATQEGAALVTSDHHELDTIAREGFCPIRFIR